MDVSTAIEWFLNDRKAENCTSETIKTYSMRLYAFVKDCGVTELEEYDADAVRSYIRRQQGRPDLKPVTIASQVRHVKAFMRWAYKEDLIPEDPFKKVKVPKVPDHDVELVTIDQFDTMLASCDPQTAWGRRDAAILLFLIDTGVRVGELVSLRKADFDIGLRQARVMGKGRRRRTVFFSVKTATAIARYQRRQRVAEQGSEYVFSGRLGRPLTSSGVYQLLGRMARRAGITGPWNPHSFRHTFATNYLRAGGDPASLQAIMGHANITTTIKNYVHLAPADLQAKYEQYGGVRK